MTEQRARRGNWMQMADGTAFWPIDPRPGDFNVAVIAEHESKLARFNGATPDVFYSVAQHSVHVSELVARAEHPWHAIDGLFHDAWESVSSDVVRPIKQDPLMDGFREIERHGEQALAKQFGLTYPWCACVQRADNIALATEKRDLMAKPPHAWAPLPDPDPEIIVPLEWREARMLFLDRYIELRRLFDMSPNAALRSPHDD